ncbi:response regulator transcription factor [Rubinisphaera sp. JC750]|uniref:response regulator transcription factor n=1 Tax=Rubinisphaera sp. JC750 TaxID=2898658 RepID=UPI001F00FD3F|nr:response regulator [Rubinisphaera sp. JC750]
MTTTSPLIYVIDDHHEARESLQALLGVHGFLVETFPAAEPFFDNYPHGVFGCVITDLRMDNMDGYEVVQRMKDERYPLPVIVVSAFATVSEAVKIMRAGADTLIQKPYDDTEILEAIQESLEQFEKRKANHAQKNDLNARFRSLSDEELEVLESMIAGLPSKAIAHQMDLSPRTVDRRRTAVFEKLEAKSLAELAMIYVEWSKENGNADSWS